jgi:uncharacterized Tic20 family protein
MQDNIDLNKPNEFEAEKASNSYLMSLLAIMVGLPIPVINLLATLVFWGANRKSTYFVRWHCTQALLSQVTLWIMNSSGLGWTLSILFGNRIVTNSYIAYIITIFCFNLVEFIITIQAAVKTRKGIHIIWWFWGPLTDRICKPRPN